MGIGASTSSASREVYKLNNIAQFPGAYAQGRYGLARGNKTAGDLWIQNDVGSDTVVITMEKGRAMARYQD
jgi:hypothetical protein